MIEPSLSTVVKDVLADLQLSLTWELADGDSIVVSDWAVFPMDTGGLDYASPAVNGHSTVARFGGGKFGHLYLVTNKIVTGSGIEQAHSMLVRADKVSATFIAGPSVAFGGVSGPLLRIVGAGIATMPPGSEAVGAAAITLATPVISGAGDGYVPGVSVGAGAIVMVQPTVVGSGEGLPPPPPVTFESINAEAWSVQKSADIVGDALLLEDLVVNRQAFDDGATAMLLPYPMKVTHRRKLNPTVYVDPGWTARGAALSDYVYAGDILTGATNNSTVTSPKPIVKWACEDQLVVGNSVYAALVASHRDAQQGRQVRTVKFIATDSLGASVSQFVTAPTLTAHASWVRQCPVWQATIDISTLAAGRIMLDYEVYPWFGAAASVAKSVDVSAASYWLAPTLNFRKDVAKYSAPPIAVVKYGGAGTIGSATYGTPSASGTVSTNPAVARANPFDTFANAQAALVAAANAAVTGQDMAGCEIWLAGQDSTLNTLDNGAARTTSGYALTVRRDPLLTKDDCFIQSMSGRLRHTAGLAAELSAWRVRFVGLKMSRKSAATHGAIYNGTTGSTPLDVWMEDCDFDMGEITGSPINGTLARGLALWGTRITSAGSATFTAREPSANSSGSIRFYGAHAIASVPGTTLNNLECATHIASEFDGFNSSSTVGSRGNYNDFVAWHTRYIRAGHVSSGMFGINAVSQLAFVNVLVEYCYGLERCFRISADGASGSTDHIVFHNFTLAAKGSANGGMNILYDETSGTPRYHTRNSFKGSVLASMAMKGGERLDPVVDQIGHYAHGHGVGHRDNFLAGSTNFNRTYPGWGVLGSQDVNNDPMFTDAKQWGPGGYGDVSVNGVGGGDYRPASGSPLIGAVRDALTSHDLAGRPRPLTGDTIGAYLPAT